MFALKSKLTIIIKTQHDSQVWTLDLRPYLRE